MTRKPSSVWSIAIYSGESPLSLSPRGGIRKPILTMDDVKDIPSRFLADPFMVRHGTQWVLFCEVMNGDTGRGEIAVAFSDDAVTWDYGGTVLREPFHLSYPHVYNWGGEFYMVPETVHSGHVMAYRAKRFPFEWEPPFPILDGSFADPTIFEHEGRWSMFLCGTPGRHDTLLLFLATSPFGPWKPHPLNPLISNNASIARPAGKVIHWNGMPLRFAQDCIPAYGTRVRAFHILELTESSYRETEAPESPVLSPGKGWNSSGMHHIDAHRLEQNEWIACVDGYRMVEHP